MPYSDFFGGEKSVWARAKKSITSTKTIPPGVFMRSCIVQALGFPSKDQSNRDDQMNYITGFSSNNNKPMTFAQTIGWRSADVLKWPYFALTVLRLGACMSINTVLPDPSKHTEWYASIARGVGIFFKGLVTGIILPFEGMTYGVARLGDAVEDNLTKKKLVIQAVQESASNPEPTSVSSNALNKLTAPGDHCQVKGPQTSANAKKEPPLEAKENLHKNFPFRP